MGAIDVVQGLFPDRQTDFVLSINEIDVVLIKQISDGTEAKDLYKLARHIESTLAEDLNVKVVIGIGTVVAVVLVVGIVYLLFRKNKYEDERLTIRSVDAAGRRAALK